MRNDWKHGMVAGVVVLALAVVANGQQSTPPPATDFAPAAPGATSANPTTDTAAPAATVTSGAGAATGALDDRPNEQSAAAASPGSTTSASEGAFPPPTPRPTSPLDQQLGSGVDAGRSTSGQAASQRGELGVWMIENGGPGVEVRRITEGSAAHQAGLQPGDVILGINGRGANSPYAVAQMIRQMPAGQAATVQFWRDGQTNQLEIVLQPAREQYEVGFRGDESMDGISRTSGDLESRVMRLEQQLASVLQELRQLRQLHHGSSPTAIGGGVTGETTTTTGVDAATATGTSTTTTGRATAPAVVTPPSSTEPSNDPFDSTSAPATQPPAAAPAATPEPAAEPAANDGDLFESSTTEEPAATEPAATEAAPAEGAATPEAAPAESESDDLF